MNYLRALVFGNAHWLWLLLLLLPLIALFTHTQRRRQKLLARIMAPRLHETLAGSVSLWKRNLRTIFLFLALALLIVALAKPRLGLQELTMKSRSRDLMIAIDTSRSMLSTDIVPTRLARAKLLAQDLLELLPGDRVGLIAFAGEAFLQAPMTLDHNAVRDSVEELDTFIIPKGGTDITSAIRVAEAAFNKEEETSSALVIMTDGEDLEENAITEAKNAAALGIKIFTIGIGSAEGSLIPIKNEQNQTDFVRDEQGKPVLSKLDVHRLQEIAQATGGFYEPCGADAARNIVQRGILPMKAGDTGSLTARKPIERYQWPVGAALLLLLFWSLLSERRSRTILFPIMMSCLIFSSSGKANTGINNYEKGDYQGALQDFEKRLQSGDTASEVRFDAGAAAYKKGDYKKAIAYFTDAMTSASPKIEPLATYNLANSLVRSGEAASDPTEKTSAWKNAIQHYDTVLKADPKNMDAKENREMTKKLLDDLKKNQDKKDQQKDSPENKNNQKDQQKPSPDKNDKKDSSKNQQPPGNGSSQGQQQNKNNDQQQSKNSPDQQKNDGSQNQPSPSPNASATPTPSNTGGGESGAGSSPTPSSSASPSPGKNDQRNSGPSPSPGSTGNQSPTPQQNGDGIQPTPQAPSGGKQDGKKSGELSGGEQGTNSVANADTAEEGTNGMMSKNQAEALLRSMQEEEQHVRMQQHKDPEETKQDW